MNKIILGLVVILSVGASIFLFTKFSDSNLKTSETKKPISLNTKKPTYPIYQREEKLIKTQEESSYWLAFKNYLIDKRLLTSQEFDEHMGFHSLNNVPIARIVTGKSLAFILKFDDRNINHFLEVYFIGDKIVDKNYIYNSDLIETESNKLKDDIFGKYYFETLGFVKIPNLVISADQAMKIANEGDCLISNNQKIEDSRQLTLRFEKENRNSENRNLYWAFSFFKSECFYACFVDAVSEEIVGPRFLGMCA